jgi:hypothetical protein
VECIRCDNKQPSGTKSTRDVMMACHKHKEMFLTCLSFLYMTYNLHTNDKICMMTIRLACNRAIESSYWRMDNDSDVELLTGYVLYRLLIELESMDLGTFPH